ncbi:hypothetical protein CO614_03180 [Lysobacteraceae bacterium NML120232]|nr:hypothetical protein CO614_03180 [Xanthomonadaceae bacterium NML120232]
MSTPATEITPKKSSAAKRYLIVLVIGLVLGAIAAVMAMRSLEARKDHFPDSVMNVMGWHMGKLKGNIETNRCNATDALPHLQTLRRMGDDLDFAFTDLASDERFAKHSANFRAVLDSALASPPLSCESLGKTLGDVGGQCKACHDDFKG